MVIAYIARQLLIRSSRMDPRSHAAFNDTEHGLLTGASTVKRLAIRLLLALVASYQLSLFTREVAKAFLQSHTTLRRAAYMRPPKEMGLLPNKVLKVLKPLYGMPESPMHWYSTYVGHHRNHLHMKQVPPDPCLMFKRTGTSGE